MAIITLPSAVRIKRVDWTLDQPAQVNRSDWTKRRQVVTQPGPAIWSATADLVVAVGERAALAGEAFVIDLEGQVNSFRLAACENDQLPRGFRTVIDGDGQYGRALRLRGGPTGFTLARGHKITVNDQMVMVMADATFDADTRATVTFKPSLRLSPADGTYVECVLPTVLMSLATSSAGWSVDPGQLYQVKQLALEEAF